ncbi:MAG: phospholipase D-like domain-containing protein [Myxococcaceae bacterium]
MRRLVLLSSLLAAAACGPNFAGVDQLPDGESTDSSDLRHRHDAGTDAGHPDAGPVIDPCSMTGARTAPLETFAAPDVAEGPFLDAINSATHTIKIEMYQFTNSSIREAVKAKATAGLDVQVMFDGSQQPVNQTSFDQLQAAGAKVFWSNPYFTYTHAKFMVVDDTVALISTGNYDGYMHSGRNFGAIDRDPTDIATLDTIFQADLDHKAPSIACTRLVVSPQNSRARHLELIGSAKHTLIIESMQFSDAAIQNAVLERKQAGVDVRVLIAAPSWVSENTNSGGWLKSNGIPARWRKTPAIHVKAFVIDGVTTFLGSENLSKTSLDHNREVGVVSTEADDAALVTDTFETDWATATDF